VDLNRGEQPVKIEMEKEAKAKDKDHEPPPANPRSSLMLLTPCPLEICETTS
jgi:hypothetical protein